MKKTAKQVMLELSNRAPKIIYRVLNGTEADAQPPRVIYANYNYYVIQPDEAVEQDGVKKYAYRLCEGVAWDDYCRDMRKRAKYHAGMCAKNRAKAAELRQAMLEHERKLQEIAAAAANR